MKILVTPRSFKNSVNDEAREKLEQFAEVKAVKPEKPFTEDELIALLDGCGGEAASYAFDDFGRGAMVIDDSLQYAEDVPAAMDDAVREMKHWVTVV